MSDHIDHEKRKRKFSSEDVQKFKDDRVSNSKLVQANDNVMQQRWLEELLARTELTDFQRRDVQESLAWLREVPMRRLSPGWQRKFRNVEYVCELKRKGTYQPPSEEIVARARTRMMLRKIRREETQPQIPDWMKDKTLLPKKPPKGRT